MCTLLDLDARVVCSDSLYCEYLPPSGGSFLGDVCDRNYLRPELLLSRERIDFVPTSSSLR